MFIVLVHWKFFLIDNLLSTKSVHCGSLTTVLRLGFWLWEPKSKLLVKMNGSMTSRIENHDNRRSYRENIRKFISTMSVKDLRHSNRNLCKIYESKLRRAQTELELLDLELDEKAGDIECSLNYSAQLSVLFSKLQGLQCEDESGKVGSFDDSLLEPSVKSTVNLVSDYLKTNDETLAPMSEFFTKLLAGGSKQKVSSYLTRFVDIIYSEEQTSPKCVENSQLSTPPDYDAIDWQSVLSVPSVSSPTEPPSFKQPKMNKKPAHKGKVDSNFKFFF